MCTQENERQETSLLNTNNGMPVFIQSSCQAKNVCYNLMIQSKKFDVVYHT